MGKHSLYPKVRLLGLCLGWCGWLRNVYDFKLYRRSEEESNPLSYAEYSHLCADDRYPDSNDELVYRAFQPWHNRTVGLQQHLHPVLPKLHLAQRPACEESPHYRKVF